MGYALSLLQWLLRTIFPYSTPDFPSVLEDLETDAHVKGSPLTITISGYRTSVENLELSPPTQNNASPHEISWTNGADSFREVG
ncbi:hypothetical protein TNCV_4820271 [Trichonephila clavipes]|nr:hypothetical protein TNCV_4820271 [Trichonephila clavipes]